MKYMMRIVFLSVGLLPIFFNGLASAIDIQQINTTELKNQIYAKDDQVKIFFLFTSWCGVCKSSFPELIALQKRFENSNRVKIIPFSLDNDKAKLEKFLNKFPKTQMVVYVPENSSPQSLVKMFRDINLSYNGAIPYTTIIANHNVLASGSYEIPSIANAVEYLLTNSSHQTFN